MQLNKSIIAYIVFSCLTYPLIHILTPDSPHQGYRLEVDIRPSVHPTIHSSPTIHHTFTIWFTDYINLLLTLYALTSNEYFNVRKLLKCYSVQKIFIIIISAISSACICRIHSLTHTHTRLFVHLAIFQACTIYPNIHIRTQPQTQPVTVPALPAARPSIARSPSTVIICYWLFSPMHVVNYKDKIYYFIKYILPSKFVRSSNRVHLLTRSLSYLHDLSIHFTHLIKARAHNHPESHPIVVS